MTTRYGFTVTKDKQVSVEPQPDGGWVLWEAYQALQREKELLEKEAQLNTKAAEVESDWNPTQ
ncbi:MAG: hypothetical protein OXR68_03935 [Alphaproteobacteria bacterium]|nr:hypothetical protein [Alphaproteobacteria bacterium]MDD9919756.1 hypothetical protein [Alphaproteobacteria bacterium]